MCMCVPLSLFAPEITWIEPPSQTQDTWLDFLSCSLSSLLREPPWSCIVCFCIFCLLPELCSVRHLLGLAQDTSPNCALLCNGLPYFLSWQLVGLRSHIITSGRSCSYGAYLERPWERLGTVAPFLLSSPHPGFLGWCLREWRQHGHGGGLPAVGPASPPCALTPFEVSGATFLSWQLQSLSVSKGLWSFPRRKGIL